MDIARPSELKGPLIIAAVTVVIVGTGLILSMLQTLGRQRELVRQNLHLTARSVHHAIATSLRPSRDGDGEEALEFRPDALDYFRELESSGAILFVGIFDDQGPRFFHSAGQVRAAEPRLPAVVREGPLQGMERAGVQTLGGVRTYVYARELPRWPPPRRHDDQEPRGDPDSSEPPGGAGDGGGRDWGDEPRGEESGSGLYLMVGLDMTDHLALYRNFRRNAQLQVLFILGAVVAIWLLSLGFLARLGASRRAASLESFQSALLDNLPDGLLTLNSQAGSDVILAANPAAHRMLGKEPGSLAGAGLDKLPPEIAARMPRGGSGHGPGWDQVEFGGLRLEILALPLPGAGNGHGAERLVLLRDRTEIMDLEEHLGEARRLAAVGTLAAGVAHEVRNPLSALRGFAQFFAKRFAGREPEEKYARTMVQEADRLDRVVSDLLFLAKPRKLQPGPVDLGSLAEEVKSLLARDLETRSATLRLDLAAAEVHADRDALKQALINLVLNGVEALGRGGASDGQEPVVEIASRLDQDKGGVWISVTDNGPGMEPEEKAKAFEPFYTSRLEGTGLGLSIVYTLMREMDGRAVIDSLPGKGTSVRLYFPGDPGTEGAGGTATVPQERDAQGGDA